MKHRLVIGRLVKSERGVYEPALREEDVLGACRQLLELNGARVFRAIERVPKCYRCGLWLGSSERGTPDLSGYFRVGYGPLIGPNKQIKPHLSGDSPGGAVIPFWIEIKRPKGKLRPSQTSWLEQARADGAIAFKADSLQAMVAEFEKYNIKIKGI